MNHHRLGLSPISAMMIALSVGMICLFGFFACRLISDDRSAAEVYKALDKLSAANDKEAKERAALRAKYPLGAVVRIGDNPHAATIVRYDGDDFVLLLDNGATATVAPAALRDGTVATAAEAPPAASADSAFWANAQLQNGISVIASRLTEPTQLRFEISPVTRPRADGTVETLLPACRATAIATPDPSPMRVQVILQRLSWVDPDGQAHEETIDGFAVDTQWGSGLPGEFKMNWNPNDLSPQVILEPTLEVKQQACRLHIRRQLSPKDAAAVALASIPPGS